MALSGEGSDGTCNQWGCASGMGAQPNWQPPGNDGLYGLESNTIDTRYPFEVAASFDHAGRMAIVVSQQGAGRSLIVVPSLVV